MRLLYNVFMLAVFTFIVLIVAMVIGNGVDVMHDTVKGTLENISTTQNISMGNISIDNVDVYSKMPGVSLLNYILIIAFIIGIVGVFMYSRRR